MLKEPSNALDVAKERFSEVIDVVNEMNFDDGKLEGGLCSLSATSDIVFGVKASDYFNSFTNYGSIKKLNAYLMSLEIQPSTVLFTKKQITIFWSPRGKLSISSNDEYLRLLKQFQAYLSLINSYGQLDLMIYTPALDDASEEEHDEDVIILPLEFSNETFSLRDGEEIKFTDLDKYYAQRKKQMEHDLGIKPKD